MLAIFGYWTLFAFANYAVFMILSNYENNSYESLNGLLVKKPLIAFCLSISVLSLAGIPPFGVFWGHYDFKYSNFKWILVFGAFCGFIFCYYALCVFKDFNSCFIYEK